MSEYISVHSEDYKRLLDSEAKLTALENCGVDNWEGYEYAMEMFYNVQNEGKIAEFVKNHMGDILEIINDNIDNSEGSGCEYLKESGEELLLERIVQIINDYQKHLDEEAEDD